MKKYMFLGIIVAAVILIFIITISELERMKNGNVSENKEPMPDIEIGIDNNIETGTNMWDILDDLNGTDEPDEDVTVTSTPKMYIAVTDENGNLIGYEEYIPPETNTPEEDIDTENTDESKTTSIPDEEEDY